MSMKKSGARRCARARRPPARRLGRRSSTRARRRPRRASHASSSSADRGAAEAVRQLARASRRVRFATNAISRAARGEVRRGELADPAGADEQHAPSRQVAEDLRRERGRGGRDRRGALADRGLGAHALADPERLPEHAVEHRAGRRPASYASRTWPRISPSPGTSESSPAATRKRCSGGLVLVQPVEHAVERLARERLRAPRRRAPRRRRRGTARCGCTSRGRRRRRATRASSAAATEIERHPLAQLDRRDVMRQADQREASCEVAPGEREPRDDDEREAAEREVRGAAARRPRDDERAVDAPR